MVSNCPVLIHSAKLSCNHQTPWTEWCIFNLRLKGKPPPKNTGKILDNWHKLVKPSLSQLTCVCICEPIGQYAGDVCDVSLITIKLFSASDWLQHSKDKKKWQEHLMLSGVMLWYPEIIELRKICTNQRHRDLGSLILWSEITEEDWRSGLVKTRRRRKREEERVRRRRRRWWKVRRLAALRERWGRRRWKSSGMAKQSQKISILFLTTCTIK